MYRNNHIRVNGYTSSVPDAAYWKSKGEIMNNQDEKNMRFLMTTQFITALIQRGEPIGYDTARQALEMAKMAITVIDEYEATLDF